MYSNDYHDYTQSIPITDGQDLIHYFGAMQALTELASNSFVHIKLENGKTVRKASNTVPNILSEDSINLIAVYSIGTIHNCLKCQCDILVLNYAPYCKQRFETVFHKNKRGILCKTWQNEKGDIVQGDHCDKLKADKSIIDYCGVCDKILREKGIYIDCNHPQCNYKHLLCLSCIDIWEMYKVFCRSHSEYIKSNEIDMFICAKRGSNIKDNYIQIKG